MHQDDIASLDRRVLVVFGILVIVVLVSIVHSMALRFATLKPGEMFVSCFRASVIF